MIHRVFTCSAVHEGHLPGVLIETTTTIGVENIDPEEAMEVARETLADMCPDIHRNEWDLTPECVAEPLGTVACLLRDHTAITIVYEHGMETATLYHQNGRVLGDYRNPFPPYLFKNEQHAIDIGETLLNQGVFDDAIQWVKDN